MKINAFNISVVMCLVVLDVFCIWFIKSIVIFGMNNQLICKERTYVVKNVKIAGSGINIVLSTWEKHYADRTVRDGCDYYTSNDIPIEGAEYKEDYDCYYQPKNK